MNGKIAFVIGAGIGYVLGTRAGREQYERIKGATQSVWQNPKVQEQVSAAEERVGSVMREQGAQMTDKAAQVVKDRIAGFTGNGSGSAASPGSTPAAGGATPGSTNTEADDRG
ncbi:YtxH domain-containing protein [Ruania alkalisoli]|uniref:YtxH domain-containing protein n=1 Tax=Ruania alkalisoli TaxID=2779775 RepID=A0A7M1SU11_9MICO|nr:YtxH domain-containing protein [Ruania alkalisoli]QOR71066.1 YtxH domain-containing protein [Ruania alkalisoli]